MGTTGAGRSPNHLGFLNFRSIGRGAGLQPFIKGMRWADTDFTENKIWNYYLFDATVGQTLTAEWDVEESSTPAVGVELSVVWDTRDIISDDAALLWGTRVPVPPTKSVDFIWDIDPVSTFQPYNVTGIKAFWIADDISQAQDNHTPVSEWNSRVGPWRLISSTSASSTPMIRATGLGGQPAIEFNGGMSSFGSYIHGDGVQSVSVAASGHVFAVVQPFPRQTGAGAVWASTDTASSSKYLYGGFAVGAADQIALNQRNTDTADAVNADVATPTEADTPYLIEWASTDTAFEMRINNVSQTVSATSGANNGDWFNSTSRSCFTVGARNSSGVTSYWGGRIAMVMVVDGVMGSTDRTNLIAWINAKYFGTPATLPFEPQDVPDAIGCWLADDSIDDYADGAAVVEVYDRAYTRTYGAPGGAGSIARPLIDYDGIAGQPAWVFDGTDDQFGGTSGPTIEFDRSAASFTSGHVFMVLQRSGSAITIMSQADGGSSDRYIRLGTNASAPMVQHNDSTTLSQATAGNILTADTPFLVEWASTDTAWEIRMNNSLQTLSMSGTNTGNWFTGFTSPDNCSWGGRNFGLSTNWFNGKIAMLLVVGPYQTDRAVFDDLMEWVADKYSLSLAGTVGKSLETKWNVEAIRKDLQLIWTTQGPMEVVGKDLSALWNIRRVAQLIVRSFDGSDDRLVTSIGALEGIGYGTACAVFRSPLGGDGGTLVAINSATPNLRLIMLGVNSSGKLFWYMGGDSGTITNSVVADEWYFACARKATGTATPRFSWYRYSTGAWIHEAGYDTRDDQGLGASTDTIDFDVEVVYNLFDGQIAARAIWKNSLPWSANTSGDTALEASGIAHILNEAAWEAFSPTVLHIFNQASTATAVTDLTGGGANQTALVGTTVTTADIPAFYELGLRWVTERAVTAVGKDLSVTWGTRTATQTETNIEWHTRAIAPPFTISVRAFEEGDRLETATGSADIFTYGTTMAILRVPVAGSHSQAITNLHSSGGTFRGSAFSVTGASKPYWYTTGHSIADFSGLVADEWYFVVVRKGTGSVAPRFSSYRYSTATWFHEEGTTSQGNFTAPGASGTINFDTWFGAQFDPFAGQILGRAIWANRIPWSADTDGDDAIEAEGMHLDLSLWPYVGDQCDVLHFFRQSSTSIAVIDVMGDAIQTLLSGTTVEQASIPGLTTDGLNLIWNVTEATPAPVGKNLGVVWNTKAAPNKTLGLIWHVEFTSAAAVTKTLALQWTTRTLAGNSLAATWNMKAAATDSVALVWTTIAHIGDQVQLVWKIVGRASDTVTFVWRTRDAVNDQVALRWNTRKAIGDVSQLYWNTESPMFIAGKDLDLQWNSNATVSDTATLSWAVQSAVADTLALAWGIRSIAADTTALAWNLVSFVTQSTELQWGVRTLINDELFVRWQVQLLGAGPGKDLPLLWRTASTTTDTVALRWGTKTKTGDTVALVWITRTKVGDTAQFIWETQSLFGLATKILVLRWTTQSNTIGQWNGQDIFAMQYGSDAVIEWVLT